MNFDEEEVKAVKRKNRQADNIMLNEYQGYSDDDDEDEIAQEKKRTPFKIPALSSEEEDEPGTNKKLLDRSDFDIRLPSVTPTSGGNIKLKDADLLANDDDVDLGESIASLETIDAFVGETKEEFNRLKRLIDEKDEELKALEDDFYQRVSSKSVELEGIGPEQEQEIDRHRHLFEMKRLMELNDRMNRIEQEKIRLLKKEQRVTARLKYRSKVIGEELAEQEQMQESESRKRELTLTKLYARLNGKIKAQVAFYEGNLKVVQRKRIPHMESNNQMLFDGIRDQKLKANWIKTPQPVVIKLMTARCMRDKMPKGDFIIRAGALDRLVDNKLYYKFIEYGERVKEQKIIDSEKEKREKMQEKDLQNLSILLSQHDDDIHSDNDDVFMKEDDEEAYQNMMAKPLFAADDEEKQSEQAKQEEEAAKRKGVTWGADVENHARGDKAVTFANNATNPATGIITMNMQRTKINFDQEEYKQIYKGQDTERVWIDFGKVNSNVLRFDPSQNPNMDFNGHKLYYMLPPSLSLLPSNVIIFEIVYLSSKEDITQDIVVGWGAFPIVNGEFEINHGKFKVPMLYGNIDFDTNKFKDIEKKYMRNVDEWLCNLYIQVKKIDLFDFRFHEEKIEFLVPKKWQKALEQQQKMNKALIESRIKRGGSNAAAASPQKEEPKKDASSDEDGSDRDGDYSSSDESIDSDLGHDLVEDARRNQRYEDDSKIAFYDYKYCISKDDSLPTSDFLRRETQARKLQFILSEIINDMGIKKSEFRDWVSTVSLASFVFWMRMIVHYVGQWIFLKVIDAPVEHTIFHWYELRMHYSFWRMEQQLGVVVMGPLSNTLLFVFFISVNHLANRYISCFPVKMCKFIAWYGVATCLDFFIICVVDMANQNLDGDLFKLYNYYEKTQSSGFIGFFMTFLVQFGMFIFNIFLFYNYIIFVHNDAKIHDIYLRITGLGRGYHIPFDNEISWNYLRQTYMLGEINNNRIIVNKYKISSAYTNDEPRIAKSYQFQRFINMKAVATDEVYWATENGQIFDCDYRNMNVFRRKTLFTLLTQVPTSIGRMARPNNIMERHRRRQQRAYSVNLRSGNGRAEGSALNEDSGDEDSMRLKRRGTVNLVKNFMVTKIQRAQQNSMVDGSMDGDGNSGRLRQLNMTGKNKSMTPGVGGHGSLLGFGAYQGATSPQNQTALGGHGNLMYGGGFGNRGNDKTGAPVDYYLDDGKNINDKSDDLL